LDASFVGIVYICFIENRIQSSATSSMQVKPAKKFIILALREYTKVEWEEFGKWGMIVYEYTKDGANGRSIS